MQGWIKLHRKMLEWEWFQKSEMVHLFIHLLLIANHKAKPWQGINVERGQVVTGLKALKKATGISTQTLRTCLSKLEKTGNLTSKSTNKFRVITICNYETYQLKETDTNKQTNKQLTINQQSTNKQLTPNKNVKKDNNEKNDKENNPFVIFESSCTSYLGIKREALTEFEDFKKAVPDWIDKLDLLLPAIKSQQEWRVNADGAFRPSWKTFKAWLAGRHWEDVLTSESSDKDCITCGAEWTKDHKYAFDEHGKVIEGKYKCKECRGKK